MKTWDEAREGMTVYLNTDVTSYDYDDNEILIKRYQKAYISSVDPDEIIVIVSGGEHDGHDLYFHPAEDTPGVLLTEEEYLRLLGTGETGRMKPEEIMADLLFAYVNKDEDLPHDFEVEAVLNAVRYLLQNYQGTKYSKEFFLGTLDEVREKRKF